MTDEEFSNLCLKMQHHSSDMISQGRMSYAGGKLVALLELFLAQVHPDERVKLVSFINKRFDIIGNEVYEDLQDYYSSIGIH